MAEHVEAELADRRARSAGSLLPKQQAAVFAKTFTLLNLFGVSGDENVPQARLPNEIQLFANPDGARALELPRSRR